MTLSDMAKISRIVPTLFMKNQIVADMAVVGEDGEVDFKGDAKFAKSKSLSEQRQYLPLFSLLWSLLADYPVFGNERFLKVSYNQLLKATGGFSIANLIGEGGFSSVYKGILDSNGDKFVAVKVLHLQNRGAHKSFLAECEAWRNIRHRNLLKIITSCSSVDFQGNDFKALVYEFMPNGSVHDWLHSSANKSKLNLIQRINILRDVATALDYLHNRSQTTIVHGDLKPSNILLDDDMVAHVGDFGLARLLGADFNQNNSTGVKGTIGYAPPEYGIGSKMTSNGDVYSFGILLLEVMSGKKPTDDMFHDGLSLHKFAYMALPDHVMLLMVMQSCFKVEKRMQRKWKNVWLQLSRLEYRALWIPHNNGCK